MSAVCHSVVLLHSSLLPRLHPLAFYCNKKGELWEGVQALYISMYLADSVGLTFLSPAWCSEWYNGRGVGRNSSTFRTK